MNNDKNDPNGRNLSDSSDNGSNIAMGPSIDLDDWRKAISAPTRYRVGSASIHMRPRDILQIAAAILVVVVIIFLVYNRGGSSNVTYIIKRPYNKIYPLTKPVAISNGKKYRIGVITDLDHDSKVENEKNLWQSFYLQGYLTVSDDMKFEVTFEEKSTELHQSLSMGELYSIIFQTVSGLIYQILHSYLVRFTILLC